MSQRDPEEPPKLKRSAPPPRRRRWGILGLLLLVGVGTVLLWPRPSAEDVWRDGQRAIRERRVEDAARAARRLERLREPIDRDWMLRAQLAMMRDRTDEAIRLLEQVSDSSPLAARARLSIGQLELRRHRFRAAERAFRDALELDPSLIQARRELIYILGFQSRSAELSEQFRQLGENAPLSFDEVLLWSQAPGMRWKAEEVVETLGEAVRQDPRDRESRLALALALIELNRLDRAEDDLRVLPKDDADALAIHARLALERGDLNRLETLLRDAPRDHPDLELARGRLAMLRGAPERAFKAFQRSIEASRSINREALTGLAQAARRLEDGRDISEELDVIQALSELVDLLRVAGERQSEPGFARRLGDVCRQAGMTDQAIAWYRLAIARDPLDTEAQSALARLERADEDDAEIH